SKSADAAETLPSAPDAQGTRVRKQPSLLRVQQRRKRPQLLECRTLGWIEFLGRSQLEEHTAGTLVPPEQHERVRIRVAKCRVFARYECNPRLRTCVYQLGGVTGYDVQSLGIRQRRARPLGLLAHVGTAIDVGSCKKIRRDLIHEHSFGYRAVPL